MLDRQVIEKEKRQKKPRVDRRRMLSEMQLQKLKQRKLQKL